MNLSECFKKSLHALPHAVGLEVMRSKSLKRLEDPVGVRRALIMSHTGIQTVLDVGANIGQYADELREWGFRGRIISFEPTIAAFNILSQRTSTDPQWSAFNFAIGAEDGVAIINVASNLGQSSSFLPMLALHREFAPRVAYVSTEQVKVKTLDGALANIVAPDEILMVKMDVQGFEHFVLGGAHAVLPRVRLIECELSLDSIYQGQLLFHDMLELLDSFGFHPIDFNPTFWHPVSGNCLQLDGIFART